MGHGAGEGESGTNWEIGTDMYALLCRRNSRIPP